MKTRVYVEQSDVETNYYAEIQKSFLWFKWWEVADPLLGNDIECGAARRASATLKVCYDNTSKEYAELTCQIMQQLYQEEVTEKQKAAKHKTTKKVWWYLFPEEEQQ